MRYRILYNSLKRFVYSTIIFIALFYPIGIVHETGHAVICVSQNGSVLWELFFQLRVICDILPSPPELSWSMGGFFGMTASIIPIFSKRIRNNPIFLGGFVGSAIFQFTYAIAEGWFHYLYMGNDPFLFWIITFIVLPSIFYFSRFKPS